MTTKSEILKKWSIPNNIRVVESDLELEILGELVAEKLQYADTKLKEMVSIFGEDVGSILESMINTDQSIEALAMLSIHDCEDIQEAIVKRVNAQGLITRLKDRKTRERLASITTGLSKSTRRMIARKAAKTKRANPSITRKAVRKRKKAMRKREAMGI